MHGTQPAQCEGNLLHTKPSKIKIFKNHFYIYIIEQSSIVLRYKESLHISQLRAVE